MAALVLLLATALQDRPALQDVRTITDDYVRSGCWLPLKVRVGGPAGFEGEVVASADGGFRTARPVRLPAGGSIDVIVPVVALARDAQVDVILRREGVELDRRRLKAALKFLDRERLVLIDPRHPESDAYLAGHLALRDGSAVVFAASDPRDWNEAADMGALEAADAVVVAEENSAELAMTVWRALGGALVTQPRRDLIERISEPATRFPTIDSAAARFANSETWIARKRDASTLFLVVYGFAFFVAVFVTWSRKGGALLVGASAVGISATFVAAFAAFYPKGNLAVRSWQVVVDAPEAPVAVSISVLRGSGRAGDVEFGRWVKPVFSTAGQAERSSFELRRVEGRWIARGISPGDPVRFVGVERLNSLDRLAPYLDEKGQVRKYMPRDSDYFVKIPRKRVIRLQDPATVAPPPVKAAGLIESSVAQVFRLELAK